MCRGVGDNGWSGCGVSGRRASCAVRLGFMCVYRRVVRACIRGQEVMWRVIRGSVGGAWVVWLAGVRGVGREMGGGVWHLPGVFRLGSALGGGDWGSPWIASCA